MASLEHSIRATLDEALATHCFSAVQLEGCQGTQRRSIALGKTHYWPNSQPIQDSTLFDIGSLTKVVLTTTLIAETVSKGKLALDAPVESVLAPLRGKKLGEISIEELLSHTSGLVWWRPIFKEMRQEGGANPRGSLLKGGLLDWFLQNEGDRFDRPRRSQCVYSDLNFLLLGLVLESIHGKSILELSRLLFGRLGMSETEFGPIADSANVAATEYRENERKALQGRVFDENTEALGGVSSHAGLFSNARDLAKLCRYWLNAIEAKSSDIDVATAKKFTSRARIVPDSSWCLGWDGKSALHSSAGQFLTKSSFGHLGYTGTSLWIDPERSAYVVLLTNRVHPHRIDERIKALRPRIHDSVAREWFGATA